MKRKVLLASCLLLVAGCHIKGPPVVEQVTSSLRVRTGDTASVAAYAIGFGSDSVSLRFSWGDGETSEWSPFVASRDTVSMVHSWAEPAHLLVKTQARDRQGHRSDWLGGVRVVVLDSAIVKWIVRLDDVVRCCPAIGPDGTIYVSGYYSLCAVDPDGKVKWLYSDLFLPGSPVVGPDGTIYVIDESHDGLSALHPDGTLKWVDTLDRSRQHSPAVDADGTVYFGTGDSAVALNPNGSVKWRAGLPGYAVSSPAITTDGQVLFAVYGGRVCVFHADGTPAFTVQLTGAEWVVAGSSGSFYAAGGPWLASFDSVGTRQWSAQLWQNVANSPAVTRDGSILIPVDDDEGHAASLGVVRDGKVAESYWTSYGGEMLTAPAADAADNVAIGSYSGHGESGEFVLLDSAFGTSWYIETGGTEVTTPTIASDGTIYVGAGASEGYLYALKGKAGLAASPWPKFQHDERNSGCAATGR